MYSSSQPAGLLQTNIVAGHLRLSVVTSAVVSLQKSGRPNADCRQRPYHAENTSSRPITEVKQHRARLVLGWVTAWEHRVSLSFSLHIIYSVRSSACTCATCLIVIDYISYKRDLYAIFSRFGSILMDSVHGMHRWATCTVPRRVCVKRALLLRKIKEEC